MKVVPKTITLLPQKQDHGFYKLTKPSKKWEKYMQITHTWHEMNTLNSKNFSFPKAKKDLKIKIKTCFFIIKQKH